MLGRVFSNEATNAVSSISNLVTVDLHTERVGSDIVACLTAIIL